MVQLKQVNNHLNNKIMNKEYVMHIAQTIKEQLVSLTPMPILMSWGIGDLSLRYSGICRHCGLK